MTGLPDACRPGTLLEGYEIQTHVRELLRLRRPGRQVGWKIGATTPVIQEFLRVPYPIAGTLYENSVHLDHATIRAADYYSLVIENLNWVAVAALFISHGWSFVENFMGRNEHLSDSKTLIDADHAYLESGGSFDAVFADACIDKSKIDAVMVGHFHQGMLVFMPLITGFMCDHQLHSRIT